MKNSVAIPALLISLFFNAGCDSDHSDAHSTDHQSVDSATDHSAHMHESSEESQITLNNGEKWLMDEHTRSMFKQMSSRLESDAAGKALGELLKADLDKLIAGCTMTGEAHNQLHLYLSKVMPTIHSLAESGQTEQQEEVKHLLATYPNYFQ